MRMPSRLHLRPHRDDRPRSRGQAVVEFALILPVFLLLTLGVVDMARVFTSYIALTNGVSNAAIFASQGNVLKWCTGTATAADVPCPAGTGATQQAQNPGNIAYQIRVEAVGLNVGSIIMEPVLCGGGACSATSASVTVTATYQMTLLTPMMTTVMGGPINMTAATTAAVQ